ncbi:hypothetical protein AVEN_176589-1 [Araneus ventricosus]|uniref:Uncharacterized protein n=1 Tax=Araneus ventricosus TaxID=182803 RepID=A0A4Y2UVV2_ARAVE|nr:hypothetical protein AVEN_176589-1 [Araneus ventricosus]
MPYNPYITKKYSARINIEICTSIKSIKYIFVYLYTDHDCAKIVFEDNGQGSFIWDGIKTFLDARYVSAPEAIWRLLEEKTYEKSHAIIRLPGNCQCICQICSLCISMMMKNVKHCKELLKETPC